MLSRSCIALIVTVGVLLAIIEVYVAFGPLPALGLLVLYVGLCVISGVLALAGRLRGRGRRYGGRYYGYGGGDDGGWDWDGGDGGGNGGGDGDGGGSDGGGGNGGGGGD